MVARDVLSDPDPTMESLVTPMLVAYAQAKGVDIHGILGAARLPTTIASVPGPVRLRVTQVSRFVEEASLALGDPHLGLTLAELLPEGFFGVAELAARTTATVGTALGRLARYSRLLVPSNMRIGCETRRDAWVCSYALEGARAPFAGRHVNELTLTLLLRFCEQLVNGARVRVVRVRFANEAPHDVSSLARRFGTNDLVFDADINELWLDRASAAMPTRGANPLLLAVLDARAETLLAEAAAPEEPLDRTLERAIADTLRANGEPTLDAVGARLGTSARTLQRRLHEHGIVFRAAIDRVRYAIARERLSRGDVSIADLAVSLGYADARAFTRAFRRWSGGLSPSAFRSARAENLDEAGAHAAE